MIGIAVRGYSVTRNGRRAARRDVLRQRRGRMPLLPNRHEASL